MAGMQTHGNGAAAMGRHGVLQQQEDRYGHAWFLLRSALPHIPLTSSWLLQYLQTEFPTKK